jgi:hypothetical protein
VEDVRAWLDGEAELLKVLELHGRPLVADGEMVRQRHRWPNEAAAEFRAEAWSIPAHLVVLFLVEVGDLLGAPILGKATRNFNRFDNALHAKAALKGSSCA